MNVPAAALCPPHEVETCNLGKGLDLRDGCDSRLYLVHYRIGAGERAARRGGYRSENGTRVLIGYQPCGGGTYQDVKPQ